MKKFIFLFFLMFSVSSSTAFAQGEYDGIWNAPFGYAAINENYGVIGLQILTPVYEEDVDGYVGMGWSIYAG